MVGCRWVFHVCRRSGIFRRHAATTIRNMFLVYLDTIISFKYIYFNFLLHFIYFCCIS